MAFIVNYALQVCDIANNSCETRYCSDSKTEVTVKCVTSFFESLKYAADHELECSHNVMIFDDNSSKQVQDLLERIIQKYSSVNIKIDYERVNSIGIMPSIRKCWSWMKNYPGDIVYQIQDDYLYRLDAIYQMIDMFVQLHSELGILPIVYHNNPVRHWITEYKYQTTPRVVVPGKSQYWLQCYDIPCTFMTAKDVFNQHWDIYEQFLSLDPKHGLKGDLENITLNRIVTDRKVFGIMPFNSLALHMQGEADKDPYINWKEWWGSVPLV